MIFPDQYYLGTENQDLRRDRFHFTGKGKKRVSGWLNSLFLKGPILFTELAGKQPSMIRKASTPEALKIPHHYSFIWSATEKVIF